MKHYSNKETDEVFGYEDDYEVTDTDLVLMTAEEFELFENPPLTVEQIVVAIKTAIQKNLDDNALLHGFDNINTIAKFLGYDNPFRSIAEQLGLRSANVWTLAETEMGKATLGARTLPTVDEMIAELELAYPSIGVA